MKGTHLLAIGKILKTQGLRGTVKVSTHMENPQIFWEKGRLYLQKEGHTILLETQTVQVQERSVFLNFLGRDSIEAVQDLVGETIFVDTTDLPDLGQDEYYWFQLLGMEVMTETGERLGVIQDILPTGSNDVYVVGEGEKEILIPAIREVICSVDTATHRMIVRPIEGLVKG